MSAAPAARTSQVLTETPSRPRGGLDVGLERLGQAQRDPGAGVAVVGRAARSAGSGSPPSTSMRTVVAVEADGDGRGAGGVEQGRGDLVGGGGQGGHDREPHRRCGRGGQRAGDLLGALVAEGRGSR